MVIPSNRRRKGSKSSFLIALIYSKSRRFPVSACSDQEIEKGDLSAGDKMSSENQNVMPILEERKLMVISPHRPQLGSKSSCLIVLICSTSRRFPVSADTNQGPEKRDLIPL